MIKFKGIVYNEGDQCLGHTYLRPSNKKYYAFFKCSNCGTEFEAFLSDLQLGRVKSCGCYRKEFMSTKQTTHGDTKEGAEYYPLYRKWIDLRVRAGLYNSDKRTYIRKTYNVSKDWLNSYETFKRDVLNTIGNMPSGGCRIEAIDKSKMICKGNVKWNKVEK